MRPLKMIAIVLFYVISCNPVESTPTTSTPVDARTSTLTFTSTAPDATNVILNVTPTASTIPLTSETSQPAPNSSSDRLLKFSGQVSRGKVFEQEISRNLVFRLEPYQYGWHIWIGDRTEPLNDYVAVVTPPYYGMNARFIEGWHFRNSDNSGSNEPGEKLVNAPQKERRFYFVLDESDYQIAYNGLNARLLSSEEEQERAREKREQLDSRKGILTITNLKLGNLKTGERAWIEYMEFEVELSLPSDFGYLNSSLNSTPVLTATNGVTLATSGTISSSVRVTSTVTLPPATVVTKQLSSGVVSKLLKTKDVLVIRSGQGGGDDPTKLTWFQFTLPTGEPKQIEYPFQNTLTTELKQRLGIASINFSTIDISPQGEKIIFLKAEEISAGEIPQDCPMCPTIRWHLWRGNSDGSGLEVVIEDVPSNKLVDAAWSVDENKVVVGLAPLYGDGQVNYLISLTKDPDTQADVVRELSNFLARPSLSPNEQYIAGALYPYDRLDELEIIDLQQNISQKYELGLAPTYPLWSTDSQWLYILGDQGQLYRLDTNNGSLTLLAEIDEHETIQKTDPARSYFDWLIFPELKMLIVGSQTGVWQVKWSEK